MKNKKFIKIFLLLAVLFLIFFIFIRNEEDTWICDNKGTWIKHGNPSAPKPTQICPGGEVKEEILILNNFRENDLLESGFIVEGKIKDAFFFEGVFPIEIQDSNGFTLGKTFVNAQTDWMTSDYVEFKTEPLIFDKKENSNGYLVFKKDNPSGLPENDKEIKIKVRF